MKRSTAAVPAVWLLALAGPLAAEEPTVGARVRFRAPHLAHQRVEGTVLSVDENSLTLKLPDQEDSTVFQRSSVEKIEVRRREGKRFVGGFIGLLAGAAIGGVIAASKSSRDCESNGFACDVKFNALLLGVPGMFIGALASPGARWEKVPQVPPSGVTVWVAPRSDRGVEARLSIRF